MQNESSIAKMVVLYFLEHSRKELSNSFLTEQILGHVPANYFVLQQAISELVEKGLVELQTISNTSFYTITEDGRSTLHYLEDQIPLTLRKDLRQMVPGDKSAMEEDRLLFPAQSYKNAEGEWMVRCRIARKTTTLFEINMKAPSEDAALAICRSWPLKSEKIYEKILEELI